MMHATRTFRPTESYRITLPRDVEEDYDGRVVSFWIAGKPLLLQLSSYTHPEGKPVSAAERLEERMRKHTGPWARWREHVSRSGEADEAVAESTDLEGQVWIHGYFVWPHLTVYATVSGPAADVHRRPNWAVQALETIRVDAG